MRRGIIPLLAILLFSQTLLAQKACDTYSYQQSEIQNDPTLLNKINALENFIRQNISNPVTARPDNLNIITIPVVVHILYHDISQNISDAIVMEQINALNRDFRRKNSDTINTPDAFRAVAADCEIEFKLAISDPQRRSTSGIIHKYTPILYWDKDDKMKFSSEMGDDAWDPKSYLNIWVCNLRLSAGYSSIVGGVENKDGVVLAFNAFGTTNVRPGYDLGRTAVHEIGHWLSLKHIWGDADCGDDFVDDTPKQSTFSSGCPTGIKISCNNAPNGNMYMNYMDYTNDECMNLFTLGQKTKMRALFEIGGPRFSILSSTGLSAPLVFESPLPNEPPRWMHPQLYPNPTTDQLKIDFVYDPRWIGKEINIVDLAGRVMIRVTINSTLQTINVSQLKPGVYIVSGNRDGDRLRQKFVKL
jgi:hypothetical protein